MNLNICEAHAFNTLDKFSLDVFVVNGWKGEVSRLSLLDNFKSLSRTQLVSWAAASAAHHAHWRHHCTFAASGITVMEIVARQTGIQFFLLAYSGHIDGIVVRFCPECDAMTIGILDFWV